MSKTSIVLVAGTILLWTSGVVVRAQSEQDTAPRVELAVRLAPVLGFESDAEYVQSLAAEVEQLYRRAKSSDDLQEQVDLYSLCIELTLGKELEPACTRFILGLYEDEDRLMAKRALVRLNEYISDMESALTEAQSGETGTLVEQSDRTRSILANYKRLFTAVASLLLTPSDGSDAPSGLGFELANPRVAASRLGLLLEQEDQSLAACVTLWRALLRQMGGETDRVLKSLPLALEPADGEAVRHEFFVRLLRCKVIASQGRHAASIALLTQLDELAKELFSDAEELSQARRTACWFRIQVLRDWAASLLKNGPKAEYDWCVNQVASLTTQHFSEDQTLLRLGFVAPDLFQRAKVDSDIEGENPSDDRSQPALVQKEESLSTE